MRTLGVVVLLAIGSIAAPCAAQLWNPFARPKAEATQAAPAAAPEAGLGLTQQDGPWHVLATTFSGEGAEEQATELAEELRTHHGLKAYVHQMTFDYADGGQVGRGVDQYGQPIKMRYRLGNERREWAVLIGDFPAIDDPEATRTLQSVKSIDAAALRPGPDGETRQNFAQLRRLQREVLAQWGKETAEGPMGGAFMTRNPLLPAEYFNPKGVDDFVAKMNSGFDHSLLDAEGKYTVKVATFRGRGVLQGAASAKSSAARRRKADQHPLVEAAENAHNLCTEMRRQGWDAYEFHDRTESYVSVGSFETVTSADGQPTPEVAQILQTFGARFDGSPTPLEKRRSATADRAKVERVTQTFNQLFSSEVGQVAQGMNPKYAQVSFEDDQAPRPIPFDIHPHVIEAPKVTVSGMFARRR
jgi:hypothetical protein